MAASLNAKPGEPRKLSDPQMPGQLHRQNAEKSWNPLIVPRELYAREQWQWKSQQPISLTVEVNGKRDFVTYAAVMQFLDKVGFVARLGVPGADTKFQNLHLIDVKRHRRNDLHISLGDLAWARSQAAVAAATPTCPASTCTSPSPDASEPRTSQAEACMLTGGSADGGIVSGSSSEGTTTHAGRVADIATGAVEGGCGTSSDSRSLGDNGRDLDAFGTSAAGLRAAGGSVCAAVRTSAADAVASSPPSPAAAPAVLRCGCRFCPCSYDLEALLEASTSADKHPDSCHGPVERAFPAKGVPSITLPPTATAAVAAHQAPIPAVPAADGPSAPGSHLSHISRERLRNLCMPGLLKAAIPSAAPLLLAANTTNPFLLRAGSAPAGVSWPPGQTQAGMDATSLGSLVSGGLELIGRELVLRPELAAKRAADTHVLVQYEIDGELEECKLQYRLVRSENGASVSMQGISKPLRGLQLLALTETEEGDLFIQAATPSIAEACALLLPYAGAPVGAAAGAAAAPSGSKVEQLVRSASGRQRRPSLKARESADEGPPASATQGAPNPGLPTSLLPPLYPAVTPLTLPTPLPAAHSRRRGRPPRARPPPSPSLPPLVSRAMQQLMNIVDGSGAMDEHMQDSHDGYGSLATGVGRPRSGVPPAGRAASSSLASEDVQLAQDGSAMAWEAEGPGRGRRSSVVPPSAPQPGCPPALPPAHRQPTARPVLLAQAHALPPRQRCTSNTGGPPTAAASGGEASAADGSGMDIDCVAGWDGVRSFAAGVAARLTNDSPSGRSGRKRSASAAGVGARQPPAAVANPGAKRGRSTPEQCSLYVGGEVAATGRQHSSPQLYEEAELEESLPSASPQGSEAAGAGTGTGQGRAARARRAPPAPKRKAPAGVSSSSAPDAESHGEDPSGADDNDDTAPSGLESGVAIASGEGPRVAVGRGSGSSDAGASEQQGPSAPPAGLPGQQSHQPRGKAKSRGSVSKSKSKPIRHPSKITNVVRNAGAILLMIGRSSLMYEKQLRATFGNNPDTSKALRLLEEQGKVIRGGLGYRMHPYHYTLTPDGLQEYDRQLLEQGPSYAFALSMGVMLPAAGAEASPYGPAGPPRDHTAEGVMAGGGGAAAVAFGASGGGEAASTAVAPASGEPSHPQGSQVPQLSVSGLPAGGQAAKPYAVCAATGAIATGTVDGIAVGSTAPSADLSRQELPPQTAVAASQGSLASEPSNKASGGCGPAALVTAAGTATPAVAVTPGVVGEQVAAMAAPGAPGFPAAYPGFPAFPLGYPSSPYTHPHTQMQHVSVKVDPSSSPHAVPPLQHPAFGNPFPVCGYVPTPYGYVPFSMYSAYASAAASAMQAGAGGMPPGMMPIPAVPSPPAVPALATQPQQAAPALPPQVPQMAAPPPHVAPMPQQVAQAGAVLPVAAPPTPTAGPQPCMQALAAPVASSALPTMHSDVTAAGQVQEPVAPPVPPPVPQHLAQAVLAPVQTPCPLPTDFQQPQESQPQQEQPPQASVGESAPAQLNLLTQLPHAAAQFRYVAEMTAGGSYRAEVPGPDGRLHCSPEFGSAMQAAAAADLLMSKLRPGEQLNLGISQQEEATLSGMSVEEVQGMLWNMSRRP